MNDQNFHFNFAFKAALSAVIVYSCLFLYFFWQTPLGQTPVLDGAENILLADRIFSGTLPAEPFYRAMLYPAYLSLFRLLGFAVEDLNAVAAISGLLFHLLNTLLIAAISFIFWQSRRAAIAAVLLYGFYPPALHFAGEPLDITMGISFLLLCFVFMLRDNHSPNSFLFPISAGLSLGIGAVLRANILPLAAIWFFALFIREKRRSAALALLALALPLLAGGLVNYFHSGRFKIMPWQGPFNLYAANSRQANGKYFQQTILLPDRDLMVNPARMESEIIYLNQSGADKIDIDEFNRFWQRRTIAEITQEPGAWLLLNLKKLYYLFNNFEQYNNKTFNFHRQLSPVLRYNPLCFGILLILALIRLANPGGKNRSLLLQAFFWLSLGVMAFYVSARFRILLVPFVAVAAAGVFTLTRTDFLRRRNLIIALLAAILSFSNFADAANTSTYNSDRLLLAHACARLGLDREQMRWADAVLVEQPENVQAIRLKLVAFTNLALAGAFGDNSAWQSVSRELDFLDTKKLYFSDTMLLQGSYQHQVKKDIAAAHQIWQNGMRESTQKDLYRAALLLSGAITPQPEMAAQVRPGSLLWYVLVRLDIIKAQSNDPARETAVKFLFKTGG